MFPSIRQPATCLLALCCWLFFSVGVGLADDKKDTSFFREEVSLRHIVDHWKLALPLREASIVIIKHLRQLNLYSDGTLVKSYHVALGEHPKGAKSKRGDSRTPEGKFYICTRNAKDSAFHIFLGLSYPGKPVAAKAVKQGQITSKQYQVIRRRLASRKAPLWNTGLGGWIGIHGGSDDAFAAQVRRERDSADWTAGCIALTNHEIEELAAATKMGTPVSILP